jgi:hypothetical protein
VLQRHEQHHRRARHVQAHRRLVLVLAHAEPHANTASSISVLANVKWERRGRTSAGGTP